MEIIFHQHQLKLKHPFTISRWTYTHRPSLIVELRAHGYSGYGEATENPYYPNTDIATMKKRIEAAAPILEKAAQLPPPQCWKMLNEELHDNPFALCALDEAYYDWYTKQKGQPLLLHWGLAPYPHAESCYTLSIDPINLMIDRMKQNPWPVYKIKLGTDHDLDIVEGLRKESDATFWVDANCAWSVSETIDKSVELKKLGVKFIEQPLPAEDWEGMRELAEKSALPLIADESCKSKTDILRCKDSFQGVNIKVMKCGGLTPALEMIKMAQTAGLKTMVGCMTESTVGISAIAHLAPLVDYADMDGQHFIDNDPADGVRVMADGIHYTSRNGTGAVLL